MAKPSVAPASKRAKYKQKHYKIYDLQNEQDCKEFSESLVFDTFALITIPDEHKASLSELFRIFRQIFKNKRLECDVNGRYIGYTQTEHVKESLWFYLNQDGTALFPRVLNKKCALNEPTNEQKICEAFTAYSSVADDVIRAVLRHKCVDEQAYLKCYNSLFPQARISAKTALAEAACTKEEKKANDEDNTINESEHEYMESPVYNAYRKQNRLSTNNLAAINYFGANNKRSKKHWFDSLPKLQKTNKDEKSSTTDAPKVPCEEHMDYTLVTLLMADQPGLQCRDIMNFEWINIDEIISASQYDRSEVIVVITGLTFGTLFHDRVSCYHSVRNLYGNNDRLSFPLFVYADPNGAIDSSFIKSTDNIRMVFRDKKLTCSEYLARNMHPSVNF